MSGINKNSGYYLKKYNILSSILKDHANWSNECTEEKNMEAKKVIVKFYHEYKKCKLDRIFCCREELGQFSSYLMYLLPITEALFEGLYQRACNELYSLLYQDYFLQERIMEDVLRCIEVFLESEIAEYEKAAKQERGVLQWISAYSGTSGVIQKKEWTIATNCFILKSSSLHCLQKSDIRSVKSSQNLC